MEVGYAKPRLEALFYDERQLKRRYGVATVKALGKRMTALHSAASLLELKSLSPTTHALTGDRLGEFAMRLPGAWRLIFRPTEPVPRHADGGIDLAAVTRITITELSEHYT